jgi:hypothetical protein
MSKDSDYKCAIRCLKEAENAEDVFAEVLYLKVARFFVQECLDAALVEKGAEKKKLSKEAQERFNKFLSEMFNESKRVH